MGVPLPPLPPDPLHASATHARSSRAPFRVAGSPNREAEQVAPDRPRAAPGPSRRTKDGSFLTDLVEQGLLTRATGTVAAPFEATYTLTERGEHAAEYGECDFPLKVKAVESVQVERPKPTRKGKGTGRGGR
jgi:hypothetical protein